MFRNFYAVEYRSNMTLKGKMSHTSCIDRGKQRQYETIEKWLQIPILIPCGRLADFQFYKYGPALKRALEVPAHCRYKF
jgi:hypothetical protein